MRLIFRVPWAILFSLLTVAPAMAFNVPALRQHVNDYGQVISEPTEQLLNGILAKTKSETGIEMAILTVDSLGGSAIEDASIKVADQWKLGTAAGDQGLLLMFAVKDRKLRIEVGQGLEGDLTDLASRRIIDDAIVPLLRAQRFDDAVLVGSFRILQNAAPTVDVEALFAGVNLESPRGRDSQRKPVPLLLLLLVLFLIFGGRSGFLPLLLLGGMGGHRSGGFGSGGFGGRLGGGGGFSGGGASGGW